MLSTMYLFFVGLAFILLFVGIAMTSAKPKKPILPGTMLATSMIIFAIVALFAFNVEVPFCANQVNSTAFDATTNVTTYVNSLTCINQVYTMEPIGFFLDGMGILALAMLFLCIAGYYGGDEDK